MADAVIVPVQSGWTSKINVTQVVQAIAMALVLLTGGKLSLTPEQQAAIVVVIGIVGNIATVIIRQYFTKTITPQSIPANSPPVALQPVAPNTPVVTK